MRKNKAIEHFGSVAALAAAIGYTPQAIYRWGRLVPYRAQCIVEIVTKGALKAKRTQ